ncbi:MAG TPA: Ig-like domain-containing protein, partial [Acidimicrobiia bacterium]|nr:Ig-like domain-containing protein [Acidimicrobiia bacterium]
MWAWGDNFYGQLGDGSTRDRNTPVQTTGLTGAAGVAGGSFHSLAMKSDGTVWAWGRNVFGQLGDGTTTNRSTPVQTSNLTTAVFISAGAHHSLAALSDGTAWAWGLNLYGQLGDGTTTNRATPTQVSTSTLIDAVAAGAFHSLGHTAQIDTTPPTVSLDQLVEGDILFHIETLTATASDDVAIDRVEFLVDGEVVATDSEAPYEASWDTTVGVDGNHQLGARAIDTSGNTATTAPITVDVANALTGAERVSVDFDRGILSVDEYVEYGVWSLHNIDPLSDRYRAGGAFLDDGATGAAIGFLAYWDQLETSTQDRIGDFMSIQEITVSGPTGAASFGDFYAHPLGISGLYFQVSTEDWPECDQQVDGQMVVQVIFFKAYRCRHDVRVTTDGELLFQVYYTVEGLDDPTLLEAIQDINPLVSRWSETVVAVDEIYRDGTALVQCDPIDFGNCNKVPDAIDQIAVSLAQSYEVYRTGLGYRPVDLPLPVAVHNTGGAVAPGVLWPVIVQVDNDKDLFYKPRHELFHAFQYKYVTNSDLARDYVLDRVSDINWWMEATAEWAAHRVAVAQGPGAQEADIYARSLDAFLGAPERKLDQWDGWKAPRQYGAFILAEYLEERSGLDSIRSTWESMDGYGGNPLQAIEDELTALSSDWAAELPAFWRANYLLKTPDGLAPYTDEAADTVWRADLDQETILQGESDSRAVALGLDQARPLRDPRRLSDGQPESATVTVERGGSSYVDLVPLDSTPGTL